ncbi:ATP-binding protein [Streptomyces hoynatensis]|nr:ATP-binding protein [Streptomyces hoynatensis]
MASPLPLPPEPGPEPGPRPEVRVLAIGLRVEPRSVGLARGWVRRTLGRWGVGAETVETAALVVSELTTNVLLHAGTPGRSMSCGLRDAPDWLRVEVTDRGGGRRSPETRSPGPWEEHGRGLCLVASLSTAWGVAEPGNGWGQTVWADLPRA